VAQQQQQHQQQPESAHASNGTSSNGTSSSTHDPLGSLTWPLGQSSKAVSRGASSQLLALGAGVGSSAAAAAAAAAASAASAAGAGLSGLLAASRGRPAERQRPAVSNLRPCVWGCVWASTALMLTTAGCTALQGTAAGEDGTEVLAVDASRGHHTRSFSSDKIFQDYDRAQQQQQQLRGTAAAAAAGGSALPGGQQQQQHAAPAAAAETNVAAGAAGVSAGKQAMAVFDQELQDGVTPAPLVVGVGAAPSADPLGVLL
jgi:hypothetical protein